MKLSHKLSILFAGITSLACFTSSAHAEDLTIRTEYGVGGAFTDPQQGIYSGGGQAGIKALFRLHPNFAVGPAVSALYLNRSVDNGNAGTAWMFGGNLRLQGAHTEDVVPFIDIEPQYVRTGNLNRPGFSVGTGVDLALEDTHTFWLGLFLRYNHMFQTAGTEGTASLNTNDVNTIFGGLALSFDAPVKQKEVDVHHFVLIPKECPSCAAHPAPVPVDVRFSETVYFNWDSAVLRWEESDKLDKLVARLNEHPKANVKISGHASPEGDFTHNTILADKRTAAVVAYITAHGVDAARITSESFGPTRPAVKNTKGEGRERNRRAELVVDFTVSQ